MLKEEIAGGYNRKVLDFEPAFMNPDHYEAFFPTIVSYYINFSSS